MRATDSSTPQRKVDSGSPFLENMYNYTTDLKAYAKTREL
jgi:hypothetical protein